MPPLEEQVGLDITSALADADELAIKAGESLEAALTSAVDSFTSSFSTAADAIQERLAEALAVEQTVPVTADTSAAEGEVSSLVSDIEASQAEIAVGADTSEAEAAIGDLGSELVEVGGDAGSAASETRGFADAAGLAAGGAALARGEVGGLGVAAGALSTTSAAGAGALLALGGSVAFLFEKGLDATSALQRFNFIVGDMREQVLRVEVGDLNEDLDKLAIKLGTDDEALRNASASLFQFALNSGASRDEAADFTNQVDALAARAVALNPALGTVDTAAEGLSVRLARGGRFASSFGLSLTAAEISARALANTGKDAAADLTLFEKSQAAAQIAVERYGDTLNDTVTRGAKNAAIEQRSLKEQLDNVFEAAGKPLVSPVLEGIKAALPSVGAFGAAVGEVAVSAIPALTATLEGVTPAIVAAGDALSFVLGVLNEIPGGTAIAAGGLVALANPVAGLAVAGFAASESIGHFVSDWIVGMGLAERRGKDFNEELTEVQRQAAGFGSLTTSQLVPALAKLADQVKEASGGFGSTTGSGLVRSLQAFREVADQDAGAAQNLLAQLRLSGVETRAYEHILNLSVGTQRAATAATEESARAAALLTGTYEEQIDVLLERNNVILGQIDLEIRVLDAIDRQEEATRTYTDALKAATDAGFNDAEANEALDDAQREAAKAAIAQSLAVRDLTLDQHEGEGAAVAAKLAQDEQIRSLEAVAGTLAPDSPLRVQLEQYIARLKAVPPDVTTTVILEGVEVTLGQLEAIKANIDGIIQSNFSGISGAAITGAGGYGGADGDPSTPFSGGGWVKGVGNGDTVSGRLTPGEFVLSRSMVAGLDAGPTVLNLDIANYGERAVATLTDGKGTVLAVAKQRVRAGVQAL